MEGRGLTLARKIGEHISLFDGAGVEVARITVCDLQRGKVRVKIKATKVLKILRGELVGRSERRSA